jgi:malic enzyme
MRAILDKKIKKITMELLLDTARAISDTVPDRKLHYDNIIPDMYDKKIQKNIAKALARLKTS